MEALLADLSRALAPPRTRRWLPWATAAAFAISTAAGALAWNATGRGRCGNGVVERGEDCDDGNASERDGCLPACKWTRCGDGKLRAGVEECDDGNAEDGDGCSARCLRCGGRDAFVWPDSGHCYARHDRLATWDQALDACVQAGGALATLSSTQETTAVHGSLLGAAPRVWIGLRRISLRDGDPAKQFSWVMGEPEPWWSPWGAGEPGPAPHDCVVVAAASTPSRGTLPPIRWSAVSCDAQAAFVCERGGWAVRPRDNHAYQFVSTPASWTAARAACNVLGAHLVTVGDGEEETFVAAQALRDFWIGARGAPAQRQFTWVTDEPFAFRHFAPGEPDGIGAEVPCLVQSGAQGWKDRHCDQRYPYVCEID